MLLNRLSRLRTTIVVLCALLLTQWSLAAHACPTFRLSGQAPSESPAAVAGTAHDPADAVPGCAQHGNPASTLCHKHCNYDDQVSGGLTVAFAAPPPALRIARAADFSQPASPAPHLGLAHATAPPLIILYCVSLT
jgi:hypothetical protein